MCRTRRSVCRKIVQYILRCTLYFSWALGLFPFLYNWKTQKLKRSRWLIFYGIILNAGLAWTIFRNYSDTLTKEREELNKRNPLVEQINNLHSSFTLLTILITYFCIWWHCEELGRIINKILDLYRKYFKKYDSEDCLSFEYYIILKALCIVFELASMLSIDLGLSPKFSYEMVLGVICILSLMLGELLVGMHFHLAVIYIYRFVWIINRELLKLVYSPDRNASKVHKLHHLYGRILKLNLRLVAIYDYQMILFILCLLTINIISVYYFLVYSLSLQHPISLVITFNFVQSLLINIMDFWLSITVCELAERASRETLKVLRHFNGITNLDLDMDRSITDFSLFCSHRRLEYNHCGLFHIHNAMGFRMTVTSVLYLVYLVQFDYMNL